MSNPYAVSSEKKFWRSAVAHPLRQNKLLTDLCVLPEISAETSISSVGSCFAQYIGGWLDSVGYKYIKSRVAAKEDVFSFAIGNVYTARFFLQWINYANQPFSDFEDAGIYFDKNNRYIDLLQPRKTERLENLDALLLNRREIGSEIFNNIKKTDVLFFTLGLTEAWIDKKGIVYPIHPATWVDDVFDELDFVNFSYSEILNDLKQIYAAIKKINPEIKWVLTVSPVPLTATASDEHVLTATTYSKAVLRAVAGDLTNEFKDVFYFPSYELVVCPHNNDFRYQHNLRAISEQGSHWVKQHLMNALGVVNKTDDTKRIHPVCDEVLLDAYKNIQLQDKPPHLTAAKQISLLGDSHMGMLAKAFERHGADYCGGMVMNGSAFADHKFVLCDEEYFVPLENAKSRALWQVILSNLQAHEASGDKKKSWIITNIGMQTHVSIFQLLRWLNDSGRGFLMVNVRDIGEFIRSCLSEHILLLLKLKEAGHNILVVSDPPFSKYGNEPSQISSVFFHYFNVMGQILSSHGIQFFNAAEKFIAEIPNPETFILMRESGEKDWIHGNEQYYDWLYKKLDHILCKELKVDGPKKLCQRVNHVLRQRNARYYTAHSMQALDVSSPESPMPVPYGLDLLSEADLVATPAGHLQAAAWITFADPALAPLLASVAPDVPRQQILPLRAMPSDVHLPLPTEQPYSLLILLTPANDWQPVLAAYWDQAPPETACVLVPWQQSLDAAQDALLDWLDATGRDPEQGPELALVEAENEDQLKSLLRQAYMTVLPPSLCTDEAILPVLMIAARLLTAVALPGVWQCQLSACNLPAIFQPMQQTLSGWLVLQPEHEAHVHQQTQAALWAELLEALL